MENLIWLHPTSDWVPAVMGHGGTDPSLLRKLALLELLDQPRTAPQLVDALQVRLGECFGRDPEQALKRDINDLRQAGFCIRYTRSRQHGYYLQRPSAEEAGQAINRQLGELDPAQVRIWQGLPAGRRLAAAEQLRQAGLQLVRARLRQARPELDWRSLNLLVARQGGAA